MPTLHLQDVHLTRGITPVFAGLQLELTEDRIGLIGNNGAGKTSLLRLLCGLEAPDQGSIHIDGLDNHQREERMKRSQHIGMMFQNPDDQIIFPTVEEELALGLPGLKKREALQKAREFLAQRGLSDWAQRAISALSQGQRQHVCWLTLLLAGPATLLLDEPYASLDLPGQARLAHDLNRSDRQLIVSTHLLDHVRTYPRVLWLDQGQVRADGNGPDVCAAYEAHVHQLIAEAAHPAKAPHPAEAAQLAEGARATETAHPAQDAAPHHG